MRRSVALILGLCGVLAGCSFGGGHAAQSVVRNGPRDGTLQGRVITQVCGGGLVIVPVRSCQPTPYQGEIVLCRKKGEKGICPAARVDLTGRYRIKLPPGRYYLVAAPGRGNVVDVTPRWVEIGEGQVRTLNISGNALRVSQQLTFQAEV
jgi:hypothetical protein